MGRPRGSGQIPNPDCISLYMTRIVGKRENMALTMEQLSITSGSLHNGMWMTGDNMCLLKMIITASLHHDK